MTPDPTSTLEEQQFAAEVASAQALSRVESQPRPGLPGAAMVSVVLDRNNHPIWIDPRFSRWLDVASLDPEATTRARATRQGQVTQGSDLTDSPVVLIYAPTESTTQWPLRMELRRPPLASDVTVVALSLSHLEDDLIAAGRAFGMSNLEARLSAALVRHGSLAKAAVQCRVTYQTARSAMQSALRLANAARQAELVSRLTGIVAGTPPQWSGVEDLLADIFKLSPREARLALLLSQGRNRKEAADIIGISDAIAKDAFANIFHSMGVQGAPEISRVVMEATAATLLTGSLHSDLPVSPERLEPLHFLARSSGGFIAFSDYGPATGRAVLVMHTTGNTRHLPRSLVRGLQNGGFRPISLDRPGFGLSDVANGAERFSMNAARDMVEVCDSLGLAQVDLIVRGGYAAAMSMAKTFPDRLGKIVALSPYAPATKANPLTGNLDLAVRAVTTGDRRAEVVAQWIGAQVTPKRIAQLLRMGLRKSPPDMKALESPEEVADYQRAVVTFSTGRVAGFIGEQREFAGPNPWPILAHAENWTVLIGAHDPLNRKRDTEGYWRKLLPGARFETREDGGRLLHLTHVGRIIEALLA